MLTCDFSHFMSGPNSFSQPNDQNGMPDCGELSQFVSSHYRAQIRHLNPLPKPAEYQEAITSSPQRRSRFFAVKVPPISNDGQQSLLETMATVAAFNRTTLNESQESANSVLASIPKSQQGCTQLQSKLQTSYKLATVCHTQQRHQFKRNLWSIIQVAEAIRLIRLDAPHSVEAGQPIRLRCLYETRGDKLQSLSWYRNGREFYRFQPFERRQPILAFNLTGIQIDTIRSRNNTVYLFNTTTETSGRYRCEATGTTFQEANLATYIDVTARSSGASKLEEPYWLVVFAMIVIASYNYMILDYHVRNKTN